ncbi:hypothetical protein ACOMHN_042720 [Nucella lapillus]
MSSVDLVQMLIHAGANVNSANQDGRTALHLACRGGYLNIVRSLIAAGTNVNRRTQDGKTCLHVAVWRGHEPVVQELVKAGADVNIPDSEGCTPVYWAARSNYMAILTVLVCAGAKVNYRVKSQWTPLHMALHLGHIDVKKTVVSLLMENQHLSQQEREETLDMLVQAGYNIHKDTWTPSHPPSSSSSSSSSSSVSQGPKRRENKKDADSPAQLMARFVDRKKATIAKLTCLCRTRLRKRLSYCHKGRSITGGVAKLPLPSIMLDFLSFHGDASFTAPTKEGSGGLQR